jgi:D-glycero-alpha-D-manno-heptose-7-phosphate kinase
MQSSDWVEPTGPASRRNSHYNVAVQIHSSAPTRIDLAGGTIDIWPLYLYHHGAQTLNAAINLRAQVCVATRREGGVRVSSVDTGQIAEAADAASLPVEGGLSLLVRLLRFFEAKDLNLTTRAESPAGAGIAGSSALNIAVCAALARWAGVTLDDERLLEIAMNLEAQAIKVPTGVQDYRPALYGGVSAVELRIDGVRRVALDVDPRELERRIVLAYTGAPRNSGTNNWAIIKRHIDGDREVFDCFERIRDTAAAMRQALVRGDWDEAGRQIAAEWDNRKRLAPGVTTPLIEDLMARARLAGSTAAKGCGAGGGGCVFFYAPPEAVPAVRDAVARGGAELLECHVETEGLRVEDRLPG